MPSFDIEKLKKDELNALAARFDTEFNDNAKLRNVKEDEWLESLRQCKGVHDPLLHQKLTSTDSKIYANYTRSKEVPLRAKLNQHLIPEKEKNWEIAPSPKPKISDDKLQGIIQPLIKQDQSGKYVFPSQDEIDVAILEFTDEASEKMEDVIYDQLTESGHNKNLRESIKSGIRYGTGIIKGPMTKPYTEQETVYVEEKSGLASTVVSFLKRVVNMGKSIPAGKWVQREVTKYRPESEVLSIWRFFPDMSTVDFDKCGFVYEFLGLTKHEMRKLAEREDFFGDVILQILKDEPDGNYKLRSWENYIQALQKDQQVIKPNTYEVYERNGYIDGSKLFAAGIIEEDKADMEYFCSFWLCGKKCIKISIWPEKVFKGITDLYHLFYYEKDETSVFGTGMPRIIRHRQLAINAGERHLLGHAAWLVAPCGDVNLAQLHPDSVKDAANFGPGSFFGVYAQGGQAQGRVLNIYPMQDNVSSLIKVLEFQRQQGDFESSLSSQLFLTPEGGNDETAKGVAVRFQSLLDFIKDLARNFDESNVSFLRSVYKWNMEFNTDDSIKGDMDVKPLGSVQNLIKDAIREQVGFFMQSLPEWVHEYINKEEFARQLFKSFFDDYQKLVLSEEQVQKNREPMQQLQSENDALQKELAKVKADYDNAKAENMRAKADLTRAKIPHEVSASIIDNEKKKTDVVKQNLDNTKTALEITNPMETSTNA